MNKRDDNNVENKLNVEISTPFSAGKFGKIYSDNRESWLRHIDNISFSLLN